MTGLIASLLLFVACLISITYVALRRSINRGIPNLAMTIAFVVAIGLSLGLMTELMGRAKPVELEFRTDNSAPVEWYELDERRGSIYVLLRVDQEPRLYHYRWNEGLAEILFGRDQKVDGNSELSEPFKNNKTLEHPWAFHPPPPPDAAPKQVEPD